MVPPNLFDNYLQLSSAAVETCAVPVPCKIMGLKAQGRTEGGNNMPNIAGFPLERLALSTSLAPDACCGMGTGIMGITVLIS